VTKPRVRNLLLAAAALAVVAGGTAFAVLARDRREVTTRSAEAYRFYRQGLENERRLYHKDALASYAKALELDPHFAMATLRLAGLFAGRDRDRAKSLVQCAAQSREALNERERLTLDIVEAELLAGEPKRAAERIRKYVERFPEDPEGYFRLAGVLVREGKPDETLATYERLVALDPNQAIAYNYLGYYFVRRRDFVKGEDFFKRYRFLAPDQANPYDSLGELYANTGRYAEAEEHLKRALEIKPDFLPAVGHLGTLEACRGNVEGAVTWYRRASDMAETWKERYAFAGAAVMAFLDAGRPEDALALLDEVVAASPSREGDDAIVVRWSYLRSRAIVLAVAGRVDEAEAELAGLPELPPGFDADGKAALEKSLSGPRAALAGARGDLEGAVRHFREILAAETERGMGDFSYYPSIFRVRTRLADALVALGRQEEAREELRPVLAVNPRFAPALEVLARIDGRPDATTGDAGR
jgi:tetratricopeptide (TPR) repeat protein